MGQREYLIIILLTFLPFKAFSSTAWLPDEGKYKYSITHAITDEESKELKTHRLHAFNVREEVLDHLISRIMYLNQRETVIKLARDNNIRLEENGEVPQYFKDEINRVINKIQGVVDKLKEQLCLLSPYQQQRITSSYLEYAPKDDMSFGIYGYFNEDSFVNSKYTSAKYKSNAKSVSLFYKYKFFQNNNFIFSIQPQIIINKRSNLSQETLQEMTLLAGITEKRGEFEFFTEGAVAASNGLLSSSKMKKIYTYAHTEGIKLPWGITLMNYTKYYIRKHPNPILKFTVYEQLSVAKTFNFSNVFDKSLTVQLGYFWDRSLKAKHYQISGGLLSLWLEI